MKGETAARFLVDLMVGKLVTWLRLLGYDTVAAGGRNDDDIARLAQREARIILTRDRELARRRNLQTILLQSERLDEQLAQLVRDGCIDLEGRRPRCPLCNGLLQAAARDEVRDHVPPYVYATQERFERCVDCSHIYWQGTHWERMTKRLERIAANSNGNPPCPSRS